MKLGAPGAWWRGLRLVSLDGTTLDAQDEQERRAFRSAATREQYEHRTFYLLRGLLWCTKCGARMSGRPDNGGRPVDSGQYGACLELGLKAVGYEDFLRQKEEARKNGRLLGIGISTMSEPLGAGNSREYDILGIKMFDSAELRVHMTGKALLRTGARGQGQGHETTWAQIVAHELGIPADDVTVEEGDTDTAPFGMGTYASRSTPVAGAAIAMVCRKVRAKARRLAAHLLEVSEEDVDWELGRFYVRSAPGRGCPSPSARWPLTATCRTA